MLEWLDHKKNIWYQWFAKRAHGKHMLASLALVSTLESFILPIPTAAVLIPILMAGAERWVFYAAFTTAFSLLGGVIGYVLALLFFDSIGVHIIDFYGLTSQMEHVQALYESNAFWVTFTGAFTPIPYKIFALSAGFLKVSFIPFITASILGRSMQFFLVGYLMARFGETMTKLVLKYFNIVALIIVLALVLYFIR